MGFCTVTHIWSFCLCTPPLLFKKKYCIHRHIFIHSAQLQWKPCGVVKLTIWYVPKCINRADTSATPEHLKGLMVERFPWKQLHNIESQTFPRRKLRHRHSLQQQGISMTVNNRCMQAQTTGYTQEHLKDTQLNTLTYAWFQKTG